MANSGFEMQSTPVICKAFTANGLKIIDFREALQIADVNHYAEIHHSGDRKQGGGKSTYPSRIQIYLVNKSGSDGQRSVTVHASIAPELTFLWLKICEQNFGSTVIPLMQEKKEKQPNGRWGYTRWPTQFGTHFQDTKSANKLVKGLSYAALIFLKNRMQTLGGWLKGTTAPGDYNDYTAEGQALKKMAASILGKQENAIQDESESYLFKVESKTDYEYTQYRVQSKSKKNGGYVPVTVLTVKHLTFRSGQSDDKAKFSQSPWYIKIQQFDALPKEKANGTVSYIPNSVQNKQEADINLSDEEFFIMMKKVTRFIDLWEIAYGVVLVKEGAAKQRDELNAYFARKNNQQYAQNNTRNQNPQANNYGGNNYDNQQYGNNQNFNQQNNYPQTGWQNRR